MKINTSGAIYSVDVIGNGEPLLLLHGFTGSKKTWQPFIKQWSERYQLVLVDIIGHGDTDSPIDLDVYTMKSVSNSLNEILQSLGIRQINVLGYSMGGRLALYFCVNYPEIVKGLLLESTSPGLASSDARKERKASDDALAERITADGVEAFVDYWENIPLFSTQLKLPEQTKMAIRNERLSQKAIGLANSLRGMGTGIQPSQWEFLTNVEIPVIIVAGEWDKKFVALSEQMNEQFSNSQLMIIPEAGHAVHIEQSTKFAEIVYEDFYQLVKDTERGDS